MKSSKAGFRVGPTRSAHSYDDDDGSKNRQVKRSTFLCGLLVHYEFL
jgi:hypothetical protein